jgi:hypothetical protein
MRKAQSSKVHSRDCHDRSRLALGGRRLRVARPLRLFLRVYKDPSEARSTDFLRRLKQTTPMKIVKVLTDNGNSPFTDRFTHKTRQPSGKIGTAGIGNRASLLPAALPANEREGETARWAYQ